MSDKGIFTDVKLSSAGNKHSISKDCFFSQEFWRNFKRDNWEKNELVLNDGTVMAPISESELFNIIVDMSERQINSFERDGNRCNEVRLNIGNDKKDLTAGYFHLYPKKEDNDFKAYAHRVEKELCGKEFSFIVDHIYMSPSMKAWTKEFLKGMYKPLKSIALGHFWSIFYGNYSSTVYGVHNHCGNEMAEGAFYFPIKGNKQMRTWYSDYINKNIELEGSHDYSKHKEASTLLSSDPGGMMYWPSDRWHIGSSAGGDVSIVLAVRSFADPFICLFDLVDNGFFDEYFSYNWLKEKLLFLKVDIHFFMLEHLKSAKQKQIKTLPFDPDDLQGSALNLPLELREIGKSFKFIFKNNLEHVLSIFWLIHLSTLGINVEAYKLPAIKPVLTSVIKRCPGTIILWRQVGAETIVIVSDYFFYELPLGFLPLVKRVVNTVEGDELIYGNLAELAQRTVSENFDEKLSDFFSFLVESQSFVEFS